MLRGFLRRTHFCGFHILWLANEMFDELMRKYHGNANTRYFGLSKTKRTKVQTQQIAFAHKISLYRVCILYGIWAFHLLPQIRKFLIRSSYLQLLGFRFRRHQFISRFFLSTIFSQKPNNHLKPTLKSSKIT